jgi:hypothetical protein
MQVDINDIGFGNVTRKNLKRARREIELISDVDVPREDFPANSSPEAYAELLHLAGLGEAYDGHPFMEFVKRADRDMHGIYRDMLAQEGIGFDYYDQLFKDVATLAIILKMEYDRPRPRQLAGLLRAPLHPQGSKTANSPSYPSGHTLQSLVVSMVIAGEYPRLAEKAMRLADAIALSRLVAGHHYPSDNAYSERIAVHILPYIRRP